MAVEAVRGRKVSGYGRYDSYADYLRFHDLCPLSAALDVAALSNALRAKRGERGVSEVGREMGLPGSTVARAERGQVRLISTYLALCAWLGVEVDTFVFTHVAPENEKPEGVAG